MRQAIVTAEKMLDKKKPKSKKSARTISIPADVLAVLSVGYIVSADGDVAHPGNYSHRFKNFLKTNNLPHIRFHDLRHFHATLMLEAGVPLKHAQSRMGHSNISMTIHYQHIRPKTDSVVINKIDEFLRGSKCGSNSKIKEKS